MKITVDPFPLQWGSLEDYFRRSAEAGFKYIEFSQRNDFWPYYTHPTADKNQIQKVKDLLKQYDLELASCIPLYRWSSPDEDERQAAIRYWQRAIDISLELGCDQMNSEFSGRPEQPERSEAQFWKSMDVIIPRIEKEGIKLNLEPHPDDFIEDGMRAIEMIRAIGSDNVGFLYCAPHTFHQGGNMREIMEYAGPLLKHLHLADTFDHRGEPPAGGRYISNPPGNPARVHQHNPIGLGEVDWDEFFQILRDIEFDGIATSTIFGWGDTWDKDHKTMYELMVKNLAAPVEEGGERK